MYKLRKKIDLLLWDIKSRIYKKVREFNFLYTILDRENRGILSLGMEINLKKAILDLGSGSGNIFSIFKKSTIVTTDISFFMCKKIKETYPKSTTICCNSNQLPFIDNSFDTISLIGLSEYIEDLEPLIKELKRVINDKGSIIFTSSPNTFFTKLRKFSGNKILIRDSREVIQLFKNSSFTLIKHNTISITQDQYLFRYNV